ncbi:MAG: hypothetical protein KA022_01925 [Candidatus Omnitrophica bacterium]|jgi:hypothetical protein|nr:hypothetical protein [Candidatus Omnitrophota bacterium]
MKEGTKQKIWEGFKSYWINALYITLFFSVFANYTRLILAHYEIAYAHYGVSLIKGLILAKVILIAEHLHIGEGFEDKPLAIPTLYKSFLFTLCVILLGAIELVIRALLHGGNSTAIFNTFSNGFSYEWLAKMWVVFVIFIPFFAMRELSRVLGRGKISKLFFQGEKP